MKYILIENIDLMTKEQEKQLKKVLKIMNIEFSILRTSKR